MLLEDQRYIHEDLERLEQGIADRMSEEPKHVGFDPCATIHLLFSRSQGKLANDCHSYN